MNSYLQRWIEVFAFGLFTSALTAALFYTNIIPSLSETVTIVTALVLLLNIAYYIYCSRGFILGMYKIIEDSGHDDESNQESSYDLARKKEVIQYYYKSHFFIWLTLFVLTVVPVLLYMWFGLDSEPVYTILFFPYKLLKYVKSTPIGLSGKEIPKIYSVLFVNLISLIPYWIVPKTIK